jgi:predicted ATP-binding protein involved in virulence
LQEKDMELSQSERIKILNECSIEIFLNHKKKITRDCILKYLSVKNYQGIQSLTLNNLPNDAQWIFLTGENGYGKTSILRAIAKGLLGDEELVAQIDKNTKIISVINSLGVNLPHLIEKGKINYNNASINIVGYGIARFNQSDDRNYGNAYTLFEDNGTLLSIEKLLLTADEPTFEKIKTIFKRIIPNLVDIKKVKNNGFYEIHYQEKNEKGDTFDSVKLNDLAAGYRGIITMIGDMMRRFNNYMEKSFEEVTGIVIIDEFDAHLHPKYQYELPKLLSTVFPKIQFIVSTHSPIPLLGVEPNTAVVLTVNRTKELGITVDRLDDDIDIDRLSANALLTSDIFGFKTIFARGATPDTIEPFDNYKDIKEMNELEKRMELKQGFKDLNIKIG